MMEAKVTSKGQITIPAEIRRALDLKTGDRISFDINENGIMINKSNHPLTIQERFENYDIRKSHKKVSEAMKEEDSGNDIGEEEF